VVTRLFWLSWSWLLAVNMGLVLLSQIILGTMWPGLVANLVPTALWVWKA
jgi:hypothetical protein